MFEYHDYKALHLVGLLFFLMALIRYHSVPQTGKYFKSFLYASAVVTFMTGTILMRRFGLGGETLPLWILIKYLISLCLIASIWLPRPSSKLVKIRPYAVYLLIVVAVYCSVYKPF